MRRHFTPSVRMIIALATGLLTGMLAGGSSRGVHLANLLAKPVAQMWLDGLTLTVVPLIVSLLVTGIAGSAQTEAAATTRRTFLWFGVALLTTCVLSAATTELLLHIWPAQPLGIDAASHQQAGTAGQDEWYASIIPANPIRAAADMAIVPLVTFSLLLGFAATRIDTALCKQLLDFFRAIVATMLVIVGWMLWIAPIGIFALAVNAGVSIGSASFAILGQYIIVVCVACLTTSLLAYGAIAALGRLALFNFARASLPAQATALSTQSSLATLPVMVETGPALGITSASTGLILPLAVSLFRAASVAANIAVALYLAKFHGVPMDPVTIAIGVLVAVPVSLAAVGLPAQISFFATIAPICIAMDVPVGMLPLLLAVETVPDLFRTVGNVTADLALLRISGLKRQQH